MRVRALLQLLGALCKVAAPALLVLALFAWDKWGSESGWRATAHECAGYLALAGAAALILAWAFGPPPDIDRVSPDAIERLNDLPLTALRGQSAVFISCEIAFRLVAVALGAGAAFWAGQTMVEFQVIHLVPVAFLMFGVFLAAYYLNDLRQFVWPTTITTQAMAMVVGYTLFQRARRIRFLLHASFWDRLSFTAIFYQLGGAIPGVVCGFIAWLVLAILSVPSQVRLDPWVSPTGMAREALLAPWAVDYSIVDLLVRFWPGEIQTILERDSIFFLILLGTVVLCFGQNLFHGLTFWGECSFAPIENPARLAFWCGLLVAPFLALAMNGLGMMPLPRIVPWYLVWLCIINVCALGAFSYDKWALDHNQQALRSWLGTIGREMTPAQQREAWAEAKLSVARISEERLVLLTLFGGLFGAEFGRLLFGHKISASKIEFRVASRIQFGRHVFFVAGFATFVTWINQFLRP